MGKYHFKRAEGSEKVYDLLSKFGEIQESKAAPAPQKAEENQAVAKKA